MEARAWRQATLADLCALALQATATLQAAQTAIAKEFSPLSDWRASADYRRQILAQLLRRVWLESTGHRTVRLEDLA